MNYGSVCSGIEAATCAWHGLGWESQWFSEIDPFPSAVLNYHFPDVPNLGDMMEITDDQLGRITDGLLVGGTPCQSFSVAGLRRGLDDPRGNLALGFLRLVDRARPRWVVWENVPGVLSSTSGQPACSPPDRLGVGPGERVVVDEEFDEEGDFACFLAALAELGYGFCYRVLDAQYVRVDRHARAVPQRRRRVFVVGYLGGWRPAAAVLLERQSMSGDPPPSRKAGAGVARSVTASTGGVSAKEQQHTFVNDQGQPLNPICMAHGQASAEIISDGEPSLTCNHEAPIVAHTLRAEGHDASEDGTGRGVPLVTAYRTSGNCGVMPQGDRTAALNCQSDPSEHIIQHASTVRRLTPRECERLQGFSDDWTLVPYRGKPAADGPRYKVLGNSMAVNVMRWIGLRIQAVDQLMKVETKP